MVNESFSHPSTRLSADADAPRPQPNPKAYLLQVGAMVRHNYTDVRTRQDHEPGIILEIRNGEAKVRWRNVTTEWVRLELLIEDAG